MLFRSFKDKHTFKIVVEAYVDVIRYIHVHPYVADIYSDVHKQILEKFKDLGLSEGYYSMYWKDEHGDTIEIGDSSDLRYIMKNVSPDTNKLFVRLGTYVDKGNYIPFRNLQVDIAFISVAGKIYVHTFK